MTNGGHHKVVSVQKPADKKQSEAVAQKPGPQQKPGQPQKA
jgi:hypothetical protein